MRRFLRPAGRKEECIAAGWSVFQPTIHLHLLSSNEALFSKLSRLEPIAVDELIPYVVSVSSHPSPSIVVCIAAATTCLCRVSLPHTTNLHRCSRWETRWTGVFLPGKLPPVPCCSVFLHDLAETGMLHFSADDPFWHHRMMPVVDNSFVKNVHGLSFSLLFDVCLVVQRNAAWWRFHQQKGKKPGMGN